MASLDHRVVHIFRSIRFAAGLVRTQIQPWHMVMMVLLLSGVIAIAVSAIAVPDAQLTHSVSISSPIQTKASEALILPTPAPYPRRKEFSAEPPALTARSAIAIDVDSAVNLYKKNETMQLWPASTTKVMTAVVALDAYDLDEIVIVKNPLTEGSVMGLVDSEQISVEHLLYGVLIQSANDAAYVLATHHSEGMAGFVDQMNRKAREIGLENTHYVDPAGFDNEKQFTTVADLARLSSYALQYKTIEKMVGIPAITVSDATFQHFHALRNVNQLLGSVPGVAGVKTGWTENAKENLINLTIRNGHRVLTVVLGSDDRFGETVTLTEWVYSSHDWDVIATE